MATRKIAARWNCRSTSTCRSGSSSAEVREPRASLRPRARRAACGSAPALSSSNSSSSSGCEAICAARNSPRAASSTSLRRTCAFSLSSAKYAEREPMASSTRSMRRRTSTCDASAAGSARSAMAANSRGISVSSRARPGASSRRSVPPPRNSVSSAAACDRVGEAARLERGGELRAFGAAHPGLDDAVDARHLGGRGFVAREHDFLEGARDARAMQVELGAAGLPVVESHGERDAFARERVRRNGVRLLHRPASAGGSPGDAGKRRPPRVPARRARAAACRRPAAAAPPAATASACAGPARRE